MGWKDKAEQADKMTLGYHRVSPVKCVREKRDGTEFKTAKGPFLMVVFEDETGAEATVNYFLTEKASWKIAKDLSRLGVDLDKMDADGTKIEQFADVKFAQHYFSPERIAWAKVSANGDYRNVELLHESDVPPHILTETAQPAADRDPAAAQPGETHDIEPPPAAPTEKEDELPF